MHTNSSRLTTTTTSRSPKTKSAYTKYPIPKPRFNLKSTKIEPTSQEHNRTTINSTDPLTKNQTFDHQHNTKPKPEGIFFFSCFFVVDLGTVELV